VLSVKPQRLNRVLTGLRDAIQPSTLVLSIVAGASIEKISTGLRHDLIVRSMPNTPAQIGEGITVWTASPKVSLDQQEMARRILEALGQEIFVEEENYLDMATALSGTGPAYVFLFMVAMVDAGVHLGFPRRIAEQLVAQTVRGSVDYYTKRDDPVHLARLRNEVTSPGGTSAAALYYLEKAGFRTAISRAIWAAYERSLELGKGGKSHPPDQPPPAEGT
jgi:pyrroline-5-carboxylate reductase